MHNLKEQKYNIKTEELLNKIKTISHVKSFQNEFEFRLIK